MNEAMRSLRKAALGGLLAGVATLTAGGVLAQDFRDRPPEDEVIYFLLPDRFANGDPSNDRGGAEGDRLATGYDPTDKGFYLGGDLTGLIGKLDYIQGLGATAIWIAPPFVNKWVQGQPGSESAAYHGYWITDFTQVDPHFGTNDDFRAFVDAAHARGMKVYLDIVINHTADVIRYRECPDWRCDYRSLADYPYTRRGGLDGPAINAGFQGDEVQTAENFARLTDPNWAYEVYVPQAERDVKRPQWLNDPIYYHNRGNFAFNESAVYGDFSGLDDVFTEHPRVIEGMIDIYRPWITDFGVDGFRIDTARHVRPKFWQAFVPAMMEAAQRAGKPNFTMFGEVYDFEPGLLATYTEVDGLPAVLDFAFQRAAEETIAKGTAGSDQLAKLFFQDAIYRDGEARARTLPTFIGNHDMGRFAQFVRQAHPDADDAEMLKRVTLGHALMMFARGAPVIYYGDEQGFVSDTGDKDAREPMFESQVAVYNDNDLVGTDETTADDNFDTGHPLYRAIADMARIRAETPALRRGRQVTRLAGGEPGLFAFSRLGEDGEEVLVVLNTAESAITANILVEAGSMTWRSLHGVCAPSSSAPGSVRVEVAPLDYIVCVSEGSR